MTPCSAIDTPFLAALVDGNTPVDTDLLEHLHGCKSCQSRLQEYQQLIAAVKTMGQKYQRPPGALQSALSQVNTENISHRSHPPRSKTFLYTAGAFLSAAALLLFFLKSGSIQNTREPGLQITMERGKGLTRSQSDLQVGDTVLLSVETSGLVALYFNDRLIQACPSQCIPNKNDRSIQLEIEKAGRYQILYVADSESVSLPEVLETAVSQLADSGQQFTLKELTVH